MSADSSPVKVIALVTAVLGLITAVLVLVNEVRKGPVPEPRGTGAARDFAPRPPTDEGRPPAATPTPARRTTEPPPPDDDPPQDGPTEKPAPTPSPEVTPATRTAGWITVSVCDELTQGAAFERADVLIGYPATPAVIQVSPQAPRSCLPYRLAGTGPYGYSVTVYLYDAMGVLRNTYVGRGQVDPAAGATYNVIWNNGVNAVELVAAG
ncbi:hypothetical protein Ssi03_20010 [Sphaerisporangium siamense]|uniref:Uncharacterized protein n=1 Tax=Sphaerisporangium siamense TaxID=795645 RepID=A0A7W7GBM2_9ACTN|nr:hypothetical protein [Sphaerisporangium siamense]MBB4705203.1 hypothetical protein [Sphaerisporangium siamense]GII84011.1 hypothetical protein Ssi03_20010 [Sphaerisporangium siamense]